MGANAGSENCPPLKIGGGVSAYNGYFPKLITHKTILPTLMPTLLNAFRAVSCLFLHLQNGFVHRSKSYDPNT